MISDNGKEDIGQILRDLGLSQAGLAAFNKQELPGIQEATTLRICGLQAPGGLYVNLCLGNGRPGAAFRLREYEGTCYLPLPFRHAVINGTDTRQLEEALGRLDWTRDYRELEKLYTVLTGAQRKLLYQYGTALYQLIMLAADKPQGKAISNALKVKYFGGTSYERFIAPELLATVKKQATFFMAGKEGMSFGEARNLLLGRAVLKTYTGRSGKQVTAWFAIPGPGRTGSNAVLFLSNEERFADYDLAPILARLPLAADNPFVTRSLITSLQAGEAPQALLRYRGRTKVFRLQADPIGQDILILDNNGEVVDRKMFMEKAQDKSRQQRQAGGRIRKKR